MEEWLPGQSRKGKTILFQTFQKMTFPIKRVPAWTDIYQESCAALLGALTIFSTQAYIVFTK